MRVGRVVKAERQAIERAIKVHACVCRVLKAERQAIERAIKVYACGQGLEGGAPGDRTSD
jgi:hypothetical protein